MDCTVVIDLLTPYIDLELKGETQAEIEMHVEKCEDCRMELQAQLGVHRLLAEKLKREKAPSDLKEVILKKAKEESKPSMWLLRKRDVEFRPITAFATVAAMILLMLLPSMNRNVSFFQNAIPNSHSQEEHALVSYSGTGLQASITGRLICTGCYLREMNNSHFDCDIDGHKLGFLGNDNSIWNFSDDHTSEKLVTNMDLKNKNVKIVGKLYYNAHYIDVDDYSLLDED